MKRRGSRTLGVLFALVVVIGAIGTNQQAPPRNDSPKRASSIATPPADEAATRPTTTTRALRVAPPRRAPAPTPSACDPSYRGACLDPSAEDYDCDPPRTGNGPRYTGRVRVVGPDHFRLDADGDGIGCG